MYSNRDNISFLTPNLPNQNRTKKNSGLYLDVAFIFVSYFYSFPSVGVGAFVFDKETNTGSEGSKGQSNNKNKQKVKIEKPTLGYKLMPVGRTRYYTTSAPIIASNFTNKNQESSNKINPFFITGLTDADGSFVCIIKKSVGHRLGWRVEVVYQIGLHKKDLELLKQIQAFFNGIGVITNCSNDMCAFRVTSPKQISDNILPHFDKYNLITKKLSDYLLFKQIVLLIIQGKHLTKEGLQSIINIRASLNLGLSEVLNFAFPKTIPVIRPLVGKAEIPDPEWMAGFITGEGCFFIKINKGRNKAGIGVQLVFQVSQHIRDQELLKSFETYFKCGRYINSLQKEWGYFQCLKFSDIYNIIIPFCTQHQIRGFKAKDFLDWVKAAEIINKGDHLTKEGSSKIIKIKIGMNTGRVS